MTSGPQSGNAVKTDGRSPALASAATAVFEKSEPGIFDLLAIFALAMILRVAFNYFLPHVNNFASCDAYEYISNAQAMLQVMAQTDASVCQKAICTIAGQASGSDIEFMRSFLAPLKDFHISGPIFPAFLAASVAAVGGSAVNAHFLWPVLLGANSFVSALSCVFIALIAARAFGRKTAVTAGVLSALYPAFIVNSGRLYSETFATFLLVLVSYLTIRGFSGGGNSMPVVFLSGLLAAALQLTRSVMVVLTAVLVPLNMLQQKGNKKLLCILPFALGFALITAPWLGFQKLAFGSGGLVVDRVGNYNFFIGNNIDTQGWLSYPYPDGRNVEARSFGTLLTQAVEKSPQRWLRLMMDKPLRLFAYPWNDFRTSIGIVSYNGQVIFHQLLLLFACLGLALCAFKSAGRKPEKPELYSRFYLLGLLAFHCVYFLFITVPRYNLSAMPELIVFAAAALTCIYELGKSKESKALAVRLWLYALLFFAALSTNLIPFICMLAVPFKYAWALQAAVRSGLLLLLAFDVFKALNLLHGLKLPAKILAATLLISTLPLLILPLRAAGRYQEWPLDLSLSSAQVKQIIRVPRSIFQENNSAAQANIELSPQARGLYLLIDSEGVRQKADGLSLSMNGEKVSAPVLPSLAFAEDFDRFLPLAQNQVQREGERMWDSLTNSAGCGNLDLRQWSMIPLSKAQLEKALAKAGTENKDFLEFELTVQNRSLKPLRIYGSYDNGAPERQMPSPAIYSWEKAFYGVENKDWLTDTRYDIKVPASSLLPSAKDLSDQPGLQNGVFNTVVLLAPPYLKESSAPSARSPGSSELCGLSELSKQKLGSAYLNHKNPLRIQIDLPTAAESSKDSIYLYRLKGRSRCTSGKVNPVAEIDTVYTKSNEESYIYKSAWAPKHLSFSRQWQDFAFLIPFKPLVESSRAAKAEIQLSAGSGQSPYLNLASKAEGELELADLELEVFRLPANPIGAGQQTF